MDNLLSVVLGFVLLAGLLPFVKVVKLALGSYDSSWFNDGGRIGEKLIARTEVVAGFAHENSFVEIREPTEMAGKRALGKFKFHNRKTFPTIHFD